MEEIRASFRKGSKPTGKLLNAVIVAKQIDNGTFSQVAAAEAGQRKPENNEYSEEECSLFF